MSAARPYTVVVGVDGSAPSQDAVRFAMRVVGDAKAARVHLCAVRAAVEELALHDTSARPARVLDDRFLEQAGAAAKAAGREALTEILHGDPAEVLVKRAAELRADLLVLGTRRAGPLRELMPGSLVLRVLDAAPCPVALVP